MTISLTLPAPAKLNLFLHINGRRADGYHLLQTVFHLLDFGDFLTFTTTQNGQIRLLTELPGVAANDNLIVRAASAMLPFRKDSASGVDISLEKNLPMGGGIGGGSSDAATTLLALNRL